MHRFVVFWLGWALLAAPLEAQQSRCADCHFANPGAPAPEHLFEWDRSPHGRNLVGCEKCHGGDPTTFESFQAHHGILNSRNPASPTHRQNLPQTCGSCHIGPFVSFQDSKHYELLRSGDEGTPTCTTCHGDVAAHLLSPQGLESQCASCHAAGRIAPRPDYPAQGKILLEGVGEVRLLLRDAERLIRRVKEKERREELEFAYQQAEVPLIEAVQAGHEFVFEALEERLALSRERAEALLDELANPDPR